MNKLELQAKDLRKTDILLIDNTWIQIHDVFIFKDVVFITAFNIKHKQTKYKPNDIVTIVERKYTDTDTIKSSTVELNRKKALTMKYNTKAFQEIENELTVTFEHLEELSKYENILIIFLGISDDKLVFKAVLYESVMANTKKLYVNYRQEQISPSWILKSLKGSDEF